MGRTHAASGAVVYLAVVPLLGMAGSPDPVSVLAGAVAAAGAAMMPDLDHPQASISRSLGPITYLLAKIVETISGGHRQATHSILGMLIGTAVAAGFSWAGGIALGLYLAFLAALGLAALHVQLIRQPVPHTIACLLLGVVLTTTAVWRPPTMLAIATAVALGMAAHIAGDCLTCEGCPLLWPLISRRFHLLSIRTDSLIERLLIGPALMLVALWLAWRLVDVHQLAAAVSGIIHQMRL